MNKTIYIFAVLITLFSLAGCDDKTIRFDEDTVRVDGTAQTVTLEADVPIATMYVTYADGKAESSVSEDGKYLECNGEWFEVSIDLDKPEIVKAKLEENNSGQERFIRIYVQRHCMRGMAEITQSGE